MEKKHVVIVIIMLTIFSFISIGIFINNTYEIEVERYVHDSYYFNFELGLIEEGHHETITVGILEEWIYLFLYIILFFVVLVIEMISFNYYCKNLTIG